MTSISWTDFIATASTHRLPILLLSPLAPLPNYLLLLYILYTLPTRITNSPYTFLHSHRFYISLAHPPSQFPCTSL
jgi:hypothetical protein